MTLKRNGFFRLLLLYLLSSTSFAAPLWGQCGDFYDGFESGVLGPQWQFGTGTYTRTVSTTNPAVGNYSLTHSSTVSNSFYQGTFATWTPSQPTYMSFWMRTDVVNNANGYVVIGNSNIPTDNGILFCYFNSTSSLRFFNTTGYNHPIVANQWYHVEARDIDWVNRNMDIYVDNVMILTNWAFRSTTAQDIDRVHLHSLTASNSMYDEIQIGAPGIIIDSVNVSEPVCNGDSTASIDVTAHSPNGVVSYTWNSGATTEDLINIPAGMYAVTLSDTAGCSSVDSIQVSEPAPVTATAAITDPICPSGNDGGIDLSPAGGSAGYGYSWSTGATTEDLSNVAAGQYQVTITDQNACIGSASFTVTEPLAFAPQDTISSPSCFGGIDGMIDLAMTGGTPGYLFSWSTGATTEDMTGLAAGLYTVTVTDTLGCMYSDTFEVVPSAPIASNAVVTDLACNGDQSGAIDLSPSGGTPVYVFSWSTGGVGEDLSNLIAGTYTVTITDVNNCLVVDTIVVNEPAAIQASAVVTNATTLPTNGAIDLSVAGGSAPFSYVWSNGATTEDVSNLSPGNYSVTITDANGCTTAANYFVDLVQSVADLTAIQVGVHPNPFVGQFQVTLAGNMLEPVQLKVFNLHGQLMWQTTTTQAQESVWTQQWPAGTYVLQVIQGKARKSILMIRD